MSVGTMGLYSHRDSFLAATQAELLQFGTYSGQHIIPPPNSFRTTATSVGGAQLQAVAPNPMAPLNQFDTFTTVNGRSGMYLTVVGREEFDVEFNNGATSFGFEFVDPTQGCNSIFEIVLRDGASQTLGRFQFQTNTAAAQVQAGSSLLGQRVFIGVTLTTAFRYAIVREIFGAEDDERFGPFYFSDGTTAGENVTAITDCDPLSGAPSGQGLPSSLFNLDVRHAAMTMPSTGLPGASPTYFSALTVTPLINPTQVATNQAIVSTQVVGLPNLSPGPLFGLELDPAFLSILYGSGFPFRGPSTPRSGTPNRWDAAWNLPLNQPIPDVFGTGVHFDATLPFFVANSSVATWRSGVIPALQWRYF